MSRNNMPWTNLSSAAIKAFIIVLVLSVAGLLFSGDRLISRDRLIKRPGSFVSIVKPSTKPLSPYDAIANMTLGVSGNPREDRGGDLLMGS